jgi:hypothetical protein
MACMGKVEHPTSDRPCPGRPCLLASPGRRLSGRRHHPSQRPETPPEASYHQARTAPRPLRLSRRSRLHHVSRRPAGWNRRCPFVVELHDPDRALRLTLTVAAHRRLLEDHLAKHGTATLIETDSAEDSGWIGRAHEVVMGSVRDRPGTANRAVTGTPARGPQHHRRADTRITGLRMAVRAAVHPGRPDGRHPGHPPPAAGGARRTGPVVRPVPQRTRDRSSAAADPGRRAARVRGDSHGGRPLGARVERPGRGVGVDAGHVSAGDRSVR